MIDWTYPYKRDIFLKSVYYPNTALWDHGLWWFQFPDFLNLLYLLGLLRHIIPAHVFRVFLRLSLSVLRHQFHYCHQHSGFCNLLSFYHIYPQTIFLNLDPYYYRKKGHQESECHSKFIISKKGPAKELTVMIVGQSSVTLRDHRK